MTKFTDDNLKWNFIKKFGFRFVFTYLTLFIISDGISRFRILFKSTIKIFDEFFLWVGSHILNIPHEFFFRFNGSGDTTYHYVVLFCILVVTVLIVTIWTLLDQRRKNYNSFYYWFSVVLRFYLGFILINYGLVKLFYLQFPEPTLYRLVQAYGDSSPMGLAWTFLSYSKGYNIFMGIAEVMSVFVLFRRTLTFGLIISFIVTINVTAINFFYDIPLKIITTHLTLIAFFLLSRDLKKLQVFFFTKNQVSLTLIDRPKVLRKLNMRKAIIILKTTFLLLILILAVFKLNKREVVLRGEFTQSQFYGIYDVISFKMNGNYISIENKINKRWKYLIMENQGVVQLIDIDDEISVFTSKIDSSTNFMQLIKVDDRKDTLMLKYEKLDDKQIIFKGKIKNDSIEATCNILKKSNFQLIKREFNLINETPFYK
jgi:hypothetical protein